MHKINDETENKHKLQMTKANKYEYCVSMFQYFKLENKNKLHRTLLAKTSKSSSYLRNITIFNNSLRTLQ